MGCIIDAVVARQSGTSQQDPVHVSAHYLQSCRPMPFEVRIKVLREGRTYSNLAADLYHDVGSTSLTMSAVRH